MGGTCCHSTVAGLAARWSESACAGWESRSPVVVGEAVSPAAAAGSRISSALAFVVTNGPITIAIRARFEYDSTTIRLQHATTRYEVFRALAYEIVYENQW